MLINREVGFGFAHVPKTAGVSIGTILAEIPGSKYIGTAHATRKPRGTDNLLWFLVVRNPYAREWSYFCHRKRCEHGLPTNRAVRHLDWPEYVERHTTDPETWDDINQAEWCQRICPGIIVRFEQLPASLNVLPFWPRKRLPHANRASQGHWRDQYTEETAQYVREWAREDFEQFGYDFESWRH
jgi:hypothetical protein